MPRSVSEVLVGTGFMYTGPENEAKPADPSVAVAGNWVEIGYSETGWALAGDFTYEDVPVAEEVDPIFVLKTAQNLRMVGTLAQPSLENLQLAFGGGTVVNNAGPPDRDEYRPPASNVFTAVALLFRVDGTGGAGKTRELYVPKATQTGSFEVRHNKAPDLALVGVEFRFLVPDAGDIFEIDELN